ncbi:MAG TPA: hypothetical protein VGI16_05720 [Candidatus Acidoferrum sp.]
MGSEADCVVKFKNRRFRGKALLETSELIFRAADGTLRLRIAFSTITSVTAANSVLQVRSAGDVALFELGDLAEKWRDKILHPKSRLEKLGVKAGAMVSVLGSFDPEFLTEIESCTKNICKGKVAKDSDWIFFAADSLGRLARLATVAKKLKGSAGLWVVYPKVQRDITENHVLAAGRKSGLKDIKVVGFSSTLTALKFVVPLDRR